MLSVAQLGMDVHKATIRMALYPDGGTTFVDERTLRADKTAVLAYLHRWTDRYELHCYYEASSCGYVVQRWLAQAGIRCTVIAPSKMPRAAGEQVKTDRRDARTLAQQGRAGTLRAVAVPTPTEEALRGLVRQYDAQRQTVRAARQRLQMWLLGRGHLYQAGEPWTQTHQRWLRALRFTGLDAEVFTQYLADVTAADALVRGSARRLQTLAAEPPYRAKVQRLCCLRGISPVRAMVIVAETLDFTRFPGAAQYMSYVGLVSREASSGPQRHQGSITKTGSAALRYAFVEAAWCYEHGPRVGVALRTRQQGQPAEVIAVAWHAQKRLNRLYWKLVHRQKPSGQAAVAVARELAGFVWALMTEIPLGEEVR